MTRMMIIFALATAVVYSQEKPSFDADTLLRNGLYHEHYRGDLDQAKSYFQKALEHPNATADIKCQAQLGLASCYLKRGNKDTGEELFANTLKGHPDLVARYAKQFDNLPDPTSSVAKRKDEDLIEKLKDRSNRIIISKVSFRDTKVSEVFQYLKAESKKVDPEKIGINFLVILYSNRVHTNAQNDEELGENDDDWGDDDDLDDDDDDFAGDFDDGLTQPYQEPTVTMDFDNIPVAQAVKYICEQGNLVYKYEDHAIVILDRDYSYGHYELRFFPIDPRAITGEPVAKVADFDFKGFFEKMGVTWPILPSGEGAAIAFDQGTSQLIVRNTPDNIRLIDKILRGLNIPTPTVKFDVAVTELDVPLSVLSRIEAHSMDEFINELPGNLKKTLSALTISGISDTELAIKKEHLINIAGKSGVVAHLVKGKAHVGNDNLTIQSDLEWSLNVKEDKYDKGALFNASMKQSLNFWDGETFCYQLLPGNADKGEKPLFLLITATIIDPAMIPLRDHKQRVGGWLKVRTAPVFSE